MLLTLLVSYLKTIAYVYKEMEFCGVKNEICTNISSIC